MDYATDPTFFSGNQKQPLLIFLGGNFKDLTYYTPEN